MTLLELNKILKDEVSFTIFSHDFRWRTFRKGDGFLVQLCCKMLDNETNLMSDQRGGKHYISSHAVKEEVINKAWNACQDFIIHEAREAFKYKNQAIYHPHWKVDKLVELAEKTAHVKRFEKSNCCDNCGEGYNNEEEWKNLKECPLCGHPKTKNRIMFS